MEEDNDDDDDDKCLIKVWKLWLFFFVSKEACQHSGGVSTVRSITSRAHKIHVSCMNKLSIKLSLESAVSLWDNYRASVL